MDNLVTPIIGFSGVIVGGVIAILKDWFLEHRRQRKIMQYSALQLLFCINEFLDHCVAVVLDVGENNGEISRDECRYPQVSLPTISYSSLEINWSSIPIDLAYKLLELPTEITKHNRYISFVSEFDSMPPDNQEVFDARVMAYSELGLNANEIAWDLRKICNLPPEKKETNEWERIPILRKARISAEQSIAKRSEAVI